MILSKRFVGIVAIGCACQIVIIHWLALGDQAAIRPELPLKRGYSSLFRSVRTGQEHEVKIWTMSGRRHYTFLNYLAERKEVVDGGPVMMMIAFAGNGR